MRPPAPAATAEDDRKAAPRTSTEPSRAEGEEEDAEEADDAAVTARLKTYIKPRIPTTQEVLDRRARKNAQSRSRAAKLRQRILEIENKPEGERTEEEIHIWTQYEQRRQRKNDRSRERALEKKEEIDRILSKPDKKRTKIEKQFLETALSAKKRKNEGDRLRRQRLKDLGISTKGTGIKPGITARGPLPPQYQHLARGGHPYYPPHTGLAMQDIPMSPLPSMPPHHHPAMPSPSGFGSPGMMPFPSPSHRGGHPPGTPSRPGAVPYMPPAPTYDPQSPAHQRGQDASRVEQRRNPDGSMSISIGGPGGAGSSFGGEARVQGTEGMNEVSGLFENEAGYTEEGQGGQQETEGKSESRDV